MSRKTRSKNDSKPISDPEIRQFLDAQSVKTRLTYERNFRVVLRISQESGREMLKNVKNWSRKIFVIQQKMIQEGYSLNSVQNRVGMIRGYFAFYKKTLDLSGSDKKKLNRTARNSEDYSFSQSDIKKMAEIGNLTEKYVLLCGVSFGLRSEDFSQITYGKYRRALERSKETPIALDPINTQKEEILSHPFISSDALPIIQALLDAHKDSRDEDLVFDERPIQLSAILQNLAHKAGIDAHGQRIRFHNLRKFLFSRLNAVSSSEQSRMIIGKKISNSDSPYLTTESLREVYMKAEPSICMSNGNGEAVKRRVSALELENQDLKKKLSFYEELMGRFKDAYQKESTSDSIGITGKKLNSVEPPEPSLDLDELKALRSFARALIDTK